MKIKSLTLNTGNLRKQQAFYSEVLGLPLLRSGQGWAWFLVGNSILKFNEEPGATPYHYAINIPSFSEQQALEWVRQRAGILTDAGREIQDFTGWNARSVYFYDPDWNIVEFISRRNLEYPLLSQFGPDCLCEISEIGIATNNIKAVYNWLGNTLGLTVFDGGLRFCAIGDETGLFICINKETKTWYPTGDRAYPSNFEVVLRIGAKEYGVTYRGQELSMNQE